MNAPHIALYAAGICLAVGIACRSSAEPEPAPVAPPAPPAAEAQAPAAAQPAEEHAPVAQSGIQPFLPAQRCAQCHSQSEKANALTSATGDDVSPHGTWQATMMANAFRDPYWRAQMAHEVERAPERKAEIEGLCLRCHAPIASHIARLEGQPPPSIEAALAHPLAQDGVSCTICHRTTSTNLGTEASFDGRLAIEGDAKIYGPFADPAPGPMKMHTGFTPTHGPHISSSALCGACHTLTTVPAHGAKPFVEQAVYLEWRNSVFSDENGRTPESRSCQECHMPDVGPMRIARNPAGLEFNIQIRDHVRAHTFVGGNAFMTDLLRANAAELGVIATEAALKRVAAAARAQLAHDTARITLSNVERKPGRIAFDVRVENLTGHKFPSGYPSRRAWLYVDVRSGGKKLYVSGDTETSGQITGVADEHALPHYDRIERADQVQVYEMLACDESGKTTTSLVDMTRRTKDNRLLPRGWKPDGPHAADTSPVGTDGDDDFAAGSDTVSYDIPVPDSDAALLVVVSLRYQSIPPAWTKALANSKTPEAARFLAMYARAENEGEAVAFATVSLPAR